MILRSRWIRAAVSCLALAGAAPARPQSLPEEPQAVLYDQFDNPAGAPPVNVASQDFEAGFDALDAQAADDFVISGEIWTIESVDINGEYTGAGPAEGFNVYFHAGSGTLPGALVASRLAQGFTGANGDANIVLSPPVVLIPGSYWISVQARQDFDPAGQWFWHNRTVQANDPAAFQNPGNGFGTGCTTWTLKSTCFAGQAPDQLFRLNGTSEPTEDGQLLVTSQTIGNGGSTFTAEAANIVDWALDFSQPAANDFAIFQTHDPWSVTIVKTAITAAGATYATFAPAALSGFDFSDYRVVILNWDDHAPVEFETAHVAALPDLATYIAGGGVVWVQAAFQAVNGHTFELPLGGTLEFNLASINFISDTGHPTMAGLPNPLFGGSASHGRANDLPAGAHIVKRQNDGDGATVLYIVGGGIFADNLETGDTCEWSLQVPAGGC